MVVHKYGGSSVSSVEKIKNIAEHVKSQIKNGEKLVVVVSAMGKTTNNLIALSEEITKSPNERELDALMSTGESQSIALLCIALCAIGVKAVSLNGMQAGIFTNSTHKRAFIRDINLKRINEEFVANDVIVVAGFQGYDEFGDITTLGRGGSDTTATAIASVLQCPCEIYTDVDGVYSVDPNLYGEAKKLNFISYGEMMEMAVCGAKVLEPRSVELACKYNIPIYLGKTLNADKSKGTYVMENNEIENMPVKNISVKDDYVIVKLKVGNDKRPKNQIFNLAQNNNINLIGSNISDKQFEIIIGLDKASLVKLESEVENIFSMDTKTLEDNKMYSKKQNMTKISLVGIGLSTHNNIAFEACELLSENDIEFVFSSNSELSLSFVINQEDKQKAVQIFAKYFNL